MGHVHVPFGHCACGDDSLSLLLGHHFW
jgi:hypothetical protein